MPGGGHTHNIALPVLGVVMGWVVAGADIVVHLASEALGKHLFVDEALGDD